MQKTKNLIELDITKHINKMGIFGQIFSKNKITINGKTYDVSGNNIVVKNDTVYVDGVIVQSGLSGIVKIEFTGDLANLDCTTAEIAGNVQGDVDCTTIKCGDIGGDVDCTTINCRDISGDVDCTTIACGSVKGDVDAMNFNSKK
jgi:hypothetical protein